MHRVSSGIERRRINDGSRRGYLLISDTLQGKLFTPETDFPAYHMLDGHRRRAFAEKGENPSYNITRATKWKPFLLSVKLTRNTSWKCLNFAIAFFSQ